MANGAEPQQVEDSHGEVEPVAAGQSVDGYHRLRDIALRSREFRTWSRAARTLAQTQPHVHRPTYTQTLRVALVGTSTLDQLGQLLPLAGIAADLDLTMHVGQFAQYESQILDSGSELYAFRPDAIVLAPDASATAISALSMDPADEIDRELERWTSTWEAVRRSTGAPVLQLNFVPPSARALGSLDGVVVGGRRAMYLELNRRLALAAHAEAGLHIVDAFAVAADFGLQRWREDRYWFHAKQAVSLAALPLLATEIVSVLRAVRGGARKCIVVDLDNTLWEGVVGEVGAQGISLSGTAVGEAHLALQQHLRDLRQRGVLLAVCSKNDDDAARSPFLQRDDMLLGLDDFVSFQANWAPKPENLRRIAAELDLGLNSFAFVDDNPAEREFVRQELPEVDVIELPADPSAYAATLAAYRGFDVVTLSPEDLTRTSSYRARAEARHVSEHAASVEDFLMNMAMEADVRRIDDITLDRAYQLVHKTNQWNLTTRRHPIETLRQMVHASTTVAFTARLVDRLADHGIVGVLIATRRDEALDIDTFLLSCRVIGRTLEHTMLDALCDAAEKLDGVTAVTGTYRRTARNGSVSNVFAQLGFQLVEDTPDESTWLLDLRSHTRPRNPFIRRKDTDAR